MLTSCSDEVGIDWLSLTGKGPGWRDAMFCELCRVCEGVPVAGGGRYNYRASQKWPCGVRLYDSHDSSDGMLDLPGGAAAILGQPIVHALLRKGLWGGRCTRIDIRRDWRFEQAVDGVQLLASIDSATRSDLLCRGLKFKSYYDGRCLSGFYLGSSGSSRFVRVYDKGIETGSAPNGAWIRWEAQLRGDFAHEGAVSIGKASEWAQVAGAIAMGVVDFREDPHEKNLARRPRCQWFADLLQFGHSRLSIKSVESTVEGFLQFAERSVFRTIKAACIEAGVDYLRVFEWLAEESHPTEVCWKNPNVFNLAEYLRNKLHKFT